MSALIEQFILQADYNHWMNQQLYRVCETIPDSERKKDMGAFFHSIHGTLNHLLLGDRLWMGRFTGSGFSITSLDQELYADFDVLHREREITDVEIDSWVRRCSDTQLQSTLEYIAAVDKQPRHLPLAKALTHLFQHQIHHRGQITTLISQLGYDFGETDLLFMP